MPVCSLDSSEQDTKSTSGACSTNTPNLPFFFSPYVIRPVAASQPGCWPARYARQLPDDRRGAWATLTSKCRRPGSRFHQAVSARAFARAPLAAPPATVRPPVNSSDDRSRTSGPGPNGRPCATAAGRSPATRTASRTQPVAAEAARDWRPRTGPQRQFQQRNALRAACEPWRTARLRVHFDELPALFDNSTGLRSVTFSPMPCGQDGRLTPSQSAAAAARSRCSIASVSTETSGVSDRDAAASRTSPASAPRCPTTDTRSTRSQLRAVQQPRRRRRAEQGEPPRRRPARRAGAGSRTAAARPDGRGGGPDGVRLRRVAALGGRRPATPRLPSLVVALTGRSAWREAIASYTMPTSSSSASRRPNSAARARHLVQPVRVGEHRQHVALHPLGGQLGVVDQQSAARLDHRLGVEPLFAVADGQRDVGGRAARRRTARRRSSRPRGRASCRPRRTRGPSGPRTVPGCRAAFRACCRTCGSSFFGPTACRIWIPARWRHGATRWTTSLSRRAPCEPPETSSVGRFGSRPKAARASGRTAARSRVAMVRRSGMPM